MRITCGQLGRIIREEARRLQEAGKRPPGMDMRRKERPSAAAPQRPSLSSEDQTTIQHLGDAMDSLELALESSSASEKSQALTEYINAAANAVARARMVLRGQKLQ